MGAVNPRTLPTPGYEPQHQVGRGCCAPRAEQAIVNGVRSLIEETGVVPLWSSGPWVRCKSYGDRLMELFEWRFCRVGWNHRQ